MATAETVLHGRESFQRQAWADAFAHLADGDSASPLDAEDLERLAAAAYLCGRDAEAEAAWARAHHAYLDRGNVERAARCAFWLAFGLMHQGDRARAGGWLARAGRMLDGYGRDCVERGYLLLPAAIRTVAGGDAATGFELFAEAARIGERFAEPDLLTLARHGQGRALIRMGHTDDGLALLDESMAAVEAGEVSPIAAGDLYCSLIEACTELFDVRRAREWTAALTRWCESQPELVPYRGQCLVYRAELMQLQGAWHAAAAEARKACEQLARPPGAPAAGAAYYQVAELHRLQGEFDEAEQAYREASRWGRTPQPGLAQLRLAQGRLDAARTAIRQAVDAARGTAPRSRLLPAYVEVMLAVDDLEAARAGARELSELSARHDAPLLRAAAARAHGAVLLAEGDAAGAVQALRHACIVWQELDAPYEAARTRALAAAACSAVQDADAAEMELAAARETFEQLGAAADLERLRAVASRTQARPHGLTPRELHVLRLVAAGKTNKAIARQLAISQRTVERHVSNIFAKLGLGSRTAAASYAHQHHLV